MTLGSVATCGSSSLPLANQAAPKTAAEQQANMANWRRVTRCSSDWRIGKSRFQCGLLVMESFLAWDLVFETLSCQDFLFLVLERNVVPDCRIRRVRCL